MKLKFNNVVQELGDISYNEDGFTMKDETGYIEKVIKKYKTSANYRKNLLPLKLKCLYNIKEYLGEEYNTYLDLLAGIGTSAKIFNRGNFSLNDFNKSCVDILKLNFTTECITALDMYSYPFQPTDFIFADFNNLTIKRMVGEYKPVLDNIFANAQKYVLLNDCSVFYLKYGQSSYKTYANLMNAPVISASGIASIPEFYITVREWLKGIYPGWFLTKVECFKDTSFLLFEKEDKTMNWHLNLNDGKLPDIIIE